MKTVRNGHRYRDAESEQTIDTWFPRSGQHLARSCLAEKTGLIKGDFIEVEIDSASAPGSTQDAYLRLHLLSECKVKPNEINLENIFEWLPNVAWTSAGPVFPFRVDALRTILVCNSRFFHHKLLLENFGRNYFPSTNRSKL